MELTPQRISEGAIAIMFESSLPFTITDYAWDRCGTMHLHTAEMWLPVSHLLQCSTAIANVSSAPSRLYRPA